MVNIKKIIFTRLAVPLFKTMASFWYEPRYLQGRYFDCSLIGWGWVLRGILIQKIIGFNRHVPWPIAPANAIDEPAGIVFHPDDLQNFMHHGCYFSNVGGGKITIGRGTLIAPNVGIVTTNHALNHTQGHSVPLDVSIGERCWLGMNSVILPGVCLGENTVVAAGSIVTKSYSEGWCVLGGTPARILKLIERPENPLFKHLSVCHDEVIN
jgi:acetyltransferase-like isoleucine patch superfamily enzyme